MHTLVTDIGISVIVATVVGIFFHRLGQPIIVAYLLAGAIIGPHFTPQLVSNPENIEVISEIGLILLLFIIGLEMSPSHLESGGRAILITGSLQFPLSVLLGVVLLPLVISGWTNLEVFYVSAAAALGSTALVIKMLYDKLELESVPGRMTLGILIFQDLWAILLLAMIPHMREPRVGPVLESLGGVLLLLAAGFLSARYVLPRAYRWISKSPEMIVGFSIGWCTAVAGAAHAIGLSSGMGALIAGLSLSIFPYASHVKHRVTPLRDFFLTLFFVSLGMKIALPGPGVLTAAFLLIAFVAIARVFIIFPLVRISGGGNRTGLLASLNLMQVSEFSLVIVSVAVAAGQVRADVLLAVTLAMAGTSIASSYLIRYNSSIYGVFHRMRRRPAVPREHVSDQAAHADAPRIVLLGFHRAARAFLDEVSRQTPLLLQQILVVDFSVEILKEVKAAYGVRVLFGDIGMEDTLHHAGAAEADIIVSTVPDLLLRGTTNRQITLLARQVAPQALVLATAETREQALELQKAGAGHVFEPYVLAGDDVFEIVGARIGSHAAG